MGLLEYSTHIIEKDDEEEIVMVPNDLKDELEVLQAKVRETMDELANYLQGMTNDELQWRNYPVHDWGVQAKAK